jgi:hypothetical protein
MQELRCSWLFTAASAGCALLYFFACSDTNTPCSNQVPAEIALKICQKIKVRPRARCRSPASTGGSRQPRPNCSEHTQNPQWLVLHAESNVSAAAAKFQLLELF